MHQGSIPMLEKLTLRHSLGTSSQTGKFTNARPELLLVNVTDARLPMGKMDNPPKQAISGTIKCSRTTTALCITYRGRTLFRPIDHRHYATVCNLLHVHVCCYLDYPNFDYLNTSTIPTLRLSPCINAHVDKQP